MRLKRVRIFGFKTFAERTEFSLDGGVVAVVGPNGCGKSNLVDAILWGLGEGSARQLRAQLGQDVIFNGSSQRKPVGFTEVSLLFDNEDGALPLDAPEVAVTRRLNRAGESEYLINRQPCRLKDVHELLADSGLGRAGYAIVGQREIDQAISASPEDRRAWVDEAAGVQRYRARKLEAQRRMASAREHLTRVDDILRELEVQREPLREEAEVAARYRVTQDALRTIESGLLIRELASATKEMRACDERARGAARQAREHSGRAASLDAQAKKHVESLAKLETEAERARQARQDAITSIERCQAEMRVVEERVRSLVEAGVTLSEAGAAGAERLRTTQTELDALEAEVEQAGLALERIRLESAGAKGQAEALSRALETAEAELVAARQTHAKRLQAEVEARHRTKRAQEIRQELAGIDRAMPELDKALTEARSQLDGAQSRVAEVLMETATLEQARAELGKLADESTTQRLDLLAEKSALDGRIRGMEATLEAHEGLSQGPKEVIAAAGRGELTHRYSAIADYVQAPAELAIAIEIALGSSANDLIVESEEAASSGIAWLTQHRKGRATFHPRAYRRGLARADIKPGDGLIGRASDLVTFAEEHRAIFEELLGSVAIVQDAKAANRVVRSGEWDRAVTLEGEVVFASGARTGGRTNGQGGGFIRRRAELEGLGSTATDLANAITELEDGELARVAEAEALAVRQAALRLNEVQARAMLDEARGYLRAIEHELAATKKEHVRLTAEFAGLEKNPEGLPLSPDLPGLQAVRDNALQALIAGNSDIEQASARIAEAESRLQQAKDRSAACLRRLQAAQEDESHRERRLAKLGPEKERLSEEIARQTDLARKAAVNRAEADSQLAELQTRRAESLRLSGELTEQARAARDQATVASESAHTAELGRARAESRRATAAERLLEEYGIGEDEALAREPTVELPSDAASLAPRLRRELKAMGEVNLGAIDAFERLTSRFDDLDGQRQDILGSIAQLHSSIGELDQLTRDRFLETFGRLQVEFADLFQRLFGGGEGRLTLTDPGEVLDCGIEIDLTLPGKRPQRLELLSGGERALCAIAFLFGLLRVKPSPLVVLDEVDAPLDGRNVERFAEVLSEFSASTQFIVVTHNPATIESAPVWLGVTMQEPGVSTLVPARTPALSYA